jgi:tetratricopeptide (TPR) repeat protein
VAIYEDMLPFYTERSDAPEKVSLYLRMGETYNRLNERTLANRAFDNALNIYRNSGDNEDKQAEAKTNVDIGFVLGGDKIKTYTEQGLSVVRNSGDALAEANTLRYIGYKLMERWSNGPTSRPGFDSEPAQAAGYVTQALKLYETVPEARIKIAETLTDLGEINLQVDKSVALQSFQKAYGLYSESEGAQRASLLYSIGLLQEEKGELEQALKSYKDADVIFPEGELLNKLHTSRAIARVEKKMANNGARP